MAIRPSAEKGPTARPQQPALVHERAAGYDHDSEHARMARIHGIVVLAAIAGGTALWFAATKGEPVAPPLPEVQEQPGDAQRSERPDTASARTRTESPATENEQKADPAVSKSADEPKPPEVAPPAAPVELSVRSLADRSPIEWFAWRFLPETGPATKGEGAAGLASLPIARGARGNLLVEAEGKQPHMQALTAPSADAPSLRIDLFLTDVAQLAGVTLQLVDQKGEPLARARIECWSVDEGTIQLDANQDPTHAPLWKRVGDAMDGALTLPDLAPGKYALRAQPVDAEGFALPLQPQRFRFAFRGGESVPLRAAFAPGVVLTLECQGDLAAPEAIDVTTRPLAGGDAIAIPWQSRGVEGRVSVGNDVVSLPGEARTAIALPIGAYSVELRRGAATQTFVPGPTQDGTTIYAVAIPR